MLRDKKKFSYLRIKLLVILLVITSLVSFAQGLSDISIIITFDTVPEFSDVETARLKYNKTFAVSMQIDDGQDAIIEEGFPVFQGGSIGTDTFKGYTYTDGCGNEHYFKMSSAIYTFNTYDGSDAHTDPSSDVVTWDELDFLFQNGWGVQNHGVNSDAFVIDDFMDYSIQRNRSYTRRMMYNSQPGGVITNVFVNPNGSLDWTNPALSLGCIGALNEQNVGPLAEYGGNVNASDLNWAETRYNLRRHDAGPKDIQDLIDTLYTQSVDGANFWAPIYTHKFTSDHYAFNKFVSDFDYLYETYGNSETGTDEVLMTTDEEIIDYLIIRDGTSLTQSLDSNVLTITFSGTIPTDLLFYDISVVVNSDAKVEDVTVNGTQDFKHAETGDTSMLINFSWDGKIIPSNLQLATEKVGNALDSGTDYDALIAMDYVYTVPYGNDKAGLVAELCDKFGSAIFDEGFCESGYPNFVEIIGDSVIIVGENAELIATPGLKSYTWSTGETTQSIIVKPEADSVFWVECLTEYNETVYDEIEVIVKNSYFLNHSPLLVPHIPGIPDTLWVDLVQGAEPLWSDGSTTDTIIVDPEETEFYECTALIGEVQGQTIEFEVFVGNLLQFTYDTVCIGDSSTMINTSLVSDTVVNVLWDLNGNGQFNDAEGDQVKHLFESPGNHLVGMRIIFKNEPMDVVYNPVSVGGIVTANFSYEGVCLGSTTEFNNNSSSTFGVIDRWFWDFGNGDTSNTKNPSNQYESAGNYNVILNVFSEFGCFDSTEEEVRIIDIEELSISTSDGDYVTNYDSVFFTEGTEFTFTITNFGSYESVKWSNGETGETFTIVDPGDYHVFGYNGDCDASKAFYAGWSSGPTPPPTPGNEIMNMFTPNGDGYNDNWLVNEPTMVYPISVKVYTRSGGLVYENGNYDNTWTGHYNGNPLPQGAYYYTIDDADGKTFKGSVTIIR